MELNDLIYRTGEWLKGAGAFSHIVMSSRVRLARNLALKPFPNKARKKDLEDVMTMVKTAMDQIGDFKDSLFLKISDFRFLMVSSYENSRELTSNFSISNS